LASGIRKLYWVTIYFKTTDNDETKNTENDIPVPFECPVDLGINVEWEIVLAVRGKDLNKKYHRDSLVIKSDGKGNLTFHQIDPNTSQPGEAISRLKLPLPNDTSAEQARLATAARQVLA